MGYDDFRIKNGAAKKMSNLVKRAPTFVRYHMNGCGHCVAMESEWDKFVSQMATQNNINIANVEQSAMSDIPSVYTTGIMGFPTLVLYVNNGKKRVDYEGERTSDALKSWLGSQSMGSNKPSKASKTSKKIKKTKKGKGKKGKGKTTRTQTQKGGKKRFGNRVSKRRAGNNNKNKK